jgi:uncharacterized membrane protein
VGIIGSMPAAPKPSDNSVPITGDTHRLPLIDALRGGAIVIMVVFHFCFDLSYFGFTDFDFYNDPFWLNARTFILTSFLLLVGASLMLANQNGVDADRVWRRFAVLLGSSLLISATTWWSAGDRFIFFGVIHFITLTSLLGLLFLRAGVLNLIIGLLLIGIGNYVQFAWFDEPGRRWVGLMTHRPLTEDYVPLLPWFGVVLLGMYLAPWLAGWARRLNGSDTSGVTRALAFAGRHSLVIYLLHQPLMMGLLSLIANG